MKDRILCILFIVLISIFAGCGKKSDKGDDAKPASDKTAPADKGPTSDAEVSLQFPAGLVSEMKENFAQGDPVLEEIKLANVLKTLQKKQSVEKQKKRKLSQEEIIGLAKEYGFTDDKDFINEANKAFRAFGLISVMAEYQVMIKAYRSQEENETALRQIKQAKTILSAQIKSTKLTLKDIEVLKKHWKTWKELTNI